MEVKPIIAALVSLLSVVVAVACSGGWSSSDEGRFLKDCREGDRICTCELRFIEPRMSFSDYTLANSGGTRTDDSRVATIAQSVLQCV